MSLVRIIPGYAQAIKAEADGRDAAFLSWPQEVCQEMVRPISLRDYLRLCVAGSPFVCGGRPDRADASMLLWHQRGAGGAVQIENKAEKRRFLAQLEQIGLEELIRAVGAFVDEALADAPASSAGASVSYWSLAATVLDAFMRAYPQMSEEAIMDRPLRQTWQLLRTIQARAGTTIFFNPSDRYKSEWAALSREQRQARLDAHAAARQSES